MTLPRHRAMQFFHPGFEAGEGVPGLRISATGALATVDGDAAVRQAVRLLLTTATGERVMRPDYGCDLHKLLFEPNDATTAGLAIHYVRQAVQRWEPRIDLVRLDAGPHPEEPARLLVDLHYRVRASRRDEHLQLALDLNAT